MKVKMYSRPQRNIGMKVLPKNCAAIVAKIRFLINHYPNKLSSEEKQELLAMITMVERNKQYLSDKVRHTQHMRLDAMIDKYRMR